MKYAKLLFFFVAMAFQADAQTLFSLTPQTVTTEKPADFFTMYSYATFENLSGTDLNMRWVKTLAIPQPLNGHGIEWGEWSITLQDPSNWHNPATDQDSAISSCPPFRMRAMTNSSCSSTRPMSPDT